jgi:hypothetical protein
MHTEVLCRNLKERDNFEEAEPEGRIILKKNFYQN